MPLFGNKKNKKIDMPEVVDFSNDTWSYKGEPPVYQIQSDGFSYDIDDTDGNDKNAISLGIAGMLIIVLNAKSPKIREDELLPHLGKVIKTRNWHSMTVKEANFLVQTAIKKLTSSSTSGDVFDLASYAPLEVKRSLLKTLFTISRAQIQPPYREEAEHRIIDDIVPEIFANPEYELASLTGLIVKPDPKSSEPVSQKIVTSTVLDPEASFNGSEIEREDSAPVTASASDSAFAELQKIYGRKADTVRSQDPNPAGADPVSQNSQPQTQPAETKAETNEPKSVAPVPVPAFHGAQPNNPFNQAEPRNIPQPGVPNFNIPQPNMPSFSPQPTTAVPQPPVPGFAPQPNNPYANMNQQGIAPNAGYPPYPVNNMQPYGGQMYPQQNMGGMNMPQMPFPGQMQNPQFQQGMGNYPSNFAPQQYPDGRTQQPYQPGMNRNPNYQPPMQTNDPTTRNQSGRNG